MTKPVIAREDALALLREQLPILRERFGIAELALFGSTARDEATPDSDVDLLVTFNRKPETSWGSYAAQTYLTDLFGRPVDLIEQHLLRKEYAPWVEADAIDPLSPRPLMSNGSRPKRWDVYVQDMIEACAKVLRYTNGIDFEAYAADSEKRDATNLNLMQIGESATKIPAHIRELHPEINWAKTIGLRHRIVHAYTSIDNEIIWTITQDFIPPLLTRLTALLAEAQAEADDAIARPDPG